tara:strand:- start:1086 stop:1775 length:690 start_codon:yes stop_codon:yes gene_type:complete
MNIIITRPLIDIDNLMTDFFKTDHKVYYIPTLKIESKKIDLIKYEDFDGLIFTSGNAIRFLNNKRTSNIKCFCVGTITEKIARSSGFTNTISSSGNVTALKNLILNSDFINKGSKLAYVCGDNITYDLDKDLQSEGIIVKKIVNYSSIKIHELDDRSLKLIKQYPPDFVFIYSLRSAESFVNIIKSYTLSPMMTQTKVMCISKKIAEYLKKKGWKNIGTFKPGEELLKV